MLSYGPMAHDAISKFYAIFIPCGQMKFVEKHMS